MINTKNQILVICGPTSSGKTSFALRVAKLLPCVNILSADSRQVYKDLDILTGKDIPKDLPSSINFFGLDLVDPSIVFNLSDYSRYARKVISDSIENHLPLIIVGGTGLYLKAITSNLLDVNISPNRKLRNKLEKLEVTELQKMLMKLNPQKLKSLNNSDLHNSRRLIRAIEITQGTPDISQKDSSSEIEFTWIGLKQDKEALEKNIHQRVIDRLNNGAIKEVTELQKKYTDSTLPIFSSLGVGEIIRFLKGEISREELIILWTSAEKDYARRQMVWFKKLTDIVWYDKSSVNKGLAKKLSGIFNQND